MPELHLFIRDVSKFSAESDNSGQRLMNVYSALVQLAVLQIQIRFFYIKCGFNMASMMFSHLVYQQSNNPNPDL